MIDYLLAKNLLPDTVVRYGIRNLLKQRINEDIGSDENEKTNKKKSFVSKQKSYDKIAVQTTEANEQHYEVPTEFYHFCLGERKKYSCCYFNNDHESLDSAEVNMLEKTIEHAKLQDGMDILELGCGWGSLSLFMAEKFPNSKITAISNSNTQREFIEASALKKGFKNLKIITCDINDFDINDKFDRVVSVEMFEHMRNYEMLLNKVSKFLKDDGKLFVHIFVHKDVPYFFDVKDESDWMSKYFFSGGIMPSSDIFSYYSDIFKVVEQNDINGKHYALTAEAWLENMDKNKEEIMRLFKKHYGNEAKKWFSYWRVFYMSCAELWKYKDGKEWFVSHYLMEKAS
jgi:cyclopropane-fatty-acyl-phospholipid synthase